MQWAIVGATGGLGRALVDEGVSRGDTVRALARRPEALPTDREGLEVVQGDLADAEALGRLVDGADAVLSAVGMTGGQDPAVFGDGLARLCGEMQARGVSRLVAISGAGLVLPGDELGLGRRIIVGLLKLLAADVLEGKRLEHAALQAAQGVDWTAVRVARMVDKPARGSVRTSLVRVEGSAVVPYADVARWMLEVAGTDAFVGQSPFVGGG